MSGKMPEHLKIDLSDLMAPFDYPPVTYKPKPKPKPDPDIKLNAKRKAARKARKRNRK